MGYLRKRLVQSLFTVYAVITLGFVLVRLMPGGPADYVRAQLRQNPELLGASSGGQPSPEQVARYMEIYMNMNPDKPLWEAYIDYLLNVVTGNLGTSIFVESGVPVAQLLAERAPWTLFLSSIGLFYGFAIGIILGSLMAYYEGTKFDVGMTVSMILDGAIPYYVVAIGLLYFLSYQMGLFPTGGRMPPGTEPGLNLPFILGVFEHGALPVASFVLTGFGGSALAMRANSIRLIGSDYIQFAEERGLSPYHISTRHIARNAILPMYTSLMIGIGFVLGGSVIVEEIFAYPGMGLLIYTATVSRDYPVIMGVLTVSVIMFVTALLIADLTYSMIDPRAEQEKGNV
jgi:peptide/nickel transport system permease protein